MACNELYAEFPVVSCTKMLLKTGTSGGHPVPLDGPMGSQKGEENGRVPAILISVGLPVVFENGTRQEGGGFEIGQGMFGPPGTGPVVYGRWKTKLGEGAGVPAGIVEYMKSEPNGPQPANVPTTAMRSRQVCGFPAFRS